LNCLDSSFWIEYFTDGPKASVVEAVMGKPEQIVVPSICLVEVGRYMSVNHGEAQAEEKIGAMARTNVLPLEAAIAGEAVRLGVKHKLAIADSIIYATARAMGATFWTMDGDFEGLPHVKYFSKKKT
jgi:predicted nucleic acid-binding protein